MPPPFTVRKIRDRAAAFVRVGVNAVEKLSAEIAAASCRVILWSL